MNGKTAVVTGAVGGIGAAICTKLEAQGYRVIGIDHPDNKRAGTSIEMIWWDLSRCRELNDMRELIDRIESALPGTLSLLVNNAAVQVVKPMSSLTCEDWEATLGVNLLAPFWLTKHLTSLLKRGRGNVVNVSSIHAEQSKPGFLTYAVSKGALETMTRSMALELAPDIRVNAVSPAATDTPMLRAGFEGKPEEFADLTACHPLRRIARPEEIAAAIAFLAGDDAGFMTGSVLKVDGGIRSVLHDPDV